MLLVTIVVLSIVLAFPRPLYSVVTAPEHVVALVALATVLPSAVAALTSRRTLRLLDRYPEQPGRGQAALGRGVTLIHVLLAVGHASVLIATDWAVLARHSLSVAHWPVVPALLSIVPFLLSTLLVWVALYPGDRAVRQIALEVYLFRGRPIRPVWTLGEYIIYNLRHQVLFILIPMALIVTARDLIAMNDQALRELSGHTYFSDVLLGLSAVIVAVIAPEILRHVWSTQRLPAGPLRDRLEALCRKVNLRCREILVWRAGGMIVNAAVMGVIAPLRYVMITDGMLEQLDDTRIEAVFGHEAGHVKRHHILFFLLYALISGCLLTIFSVRTRGLDPDSLEFQLLGVALGLLLLIKWGVVFGWISRQFERQADMFGVRVLAVSGLPCNLPCPVHEQDHDNRGPSTRGTAPLCTSAAHVFSATLNDVAVLNGINPQGRSWRHGSIGSRSRRLQRLATRPEEARRAERRILFIKVGIFGVALLMSAWAGWEIQIWKLLGLGL